MYKRILVPIDGSATSERGLEEGIRLARESGGELRILHVVDLHANAYGAVEGAAVIADYLDALHKAGRALLDRAQGRAASAGLNAVAGTMVDTVAGTVAHSIVAEAKDFRADLIVMGTHGRRGVKRLLMGSDASTVASLADVPVLLVRLTETRAA